MKAIWHNTVLAESENTVLSQSKHYFPPDSIKKEFLRDSDTHTACPFRGTCSYYDIVIGGEINKDAAWYFTEALGANKKLNYHVAFDEKKGVIIE